MTTFVSNGNVHAKRCYGDGSACRSIGLMTNGTIGSFPGPTKRWIKRDTNRNDKERTNDHAHKRTRPTHRVCNAGLATGANSGWKPQWMDAIAASKPSRPAIATTCTTPSCWIARDATGPICRRGPSTAGKHSITGMPRIAPIRRASRMPSSTTSSGRATGIASYLRVDPAVGSIEVGYINFAPPLQRTRMATEAMYLMMARVFDELGYRRYEWKCDALNAPSRNAALRLGFLYEGQFRQATMYKEPQPRYRLAGHHRQRLAGAEAGPSKAGWTNPTSMKPACNEPGWRRWSRQIDRPAQFPDDPARLVL